ncbi:hypothetical protein ABIE09_002586 [Lysobacter enzymogenes]|uniref:hypothetical protein n=1 Tax=Lysobacter enzymogenes TaxID=69 RepID=UPI000894E24F|nr:hypothetical protein [Lysobacter enzymogenes]SDW08672.1 hypothetical protein SAMN05421681_101102 [Lysobacter enzymogenes]
MNRNNDRDARFDDPATAREWALQERAREHERAGAPMSEGDPRLAQYRLLSRALRAPPMEPIPYGFAEQVARRAAAAADAGDRVERWLQQLLLFGLIAAGAGMVLGGAASWWPQAMAQLQRLPEAGVSWGAVAVACCLASWGWSGIARALGLEPGAPSRPA